MRYLDNITSLNELNNHEQLQMKITELISESSQHKFALITINVDDFTTVNDTFGFEISQILLVKIANRIRRNMRLCDFLSVGDKDEFSLLITTLDTFDYLKNIAERFLMLFNKPFEVDGRVLDISVSIGISLYPDHSNQVDSLIQYANIAMYFSKSTGQNSLTIFSNNMNDNVEVKTMLLQEIKTAIDEKQFRIYYQPHINSKNNDIVGAEALLRWHHPKQVMVLPSDYLQVAEESGLMGKIEDWIISEIFQQMHIWKRLKKWHIPISINLSVSHLNQTDFIFNLEKTMELYDIYPSMVIFEIPEQAITNYHPQISLSIEQLVTLGFGICIDNFRAESASLKYIKKHPIKQIKLIRDFVNGIYSNRKDEAIINTIASLTEELDIDIIAKGVEHLDQIEFLKSINCYVIQGYYYSKPLDISDFENYINQHEK